MNRSAMNYRRWRKRVENEPQSDLSTVSTLGGLLGDALARIAMKSGLVYETETGQWIRRS